MDYVFSLDKFEGPLDLLLHLIKEANIDICDIEIEKITVQYLNYIHKSIELNLNVASEYLVMAAELIEMKSKVLLPTYEDDSEENEEDPRESLIKRLTLYQHYSDITSKFKNLEMERKEYYTKDPSLIPYEVNLNSNLPDDLDINTLLNAFNKFMERLEMSKPLQTKVTNNEYSVTKRSFQIKKIIGEKGKIMFNKLFDKWDKDYIVVTFLSILNLVKSGDIWIKQDYNFDDILLCAKDVIV